jgi:hypothetical protein
MPERLVRRPMPLSSHYRMNSVPVPTGADVRPHAAALATLGSTYRHSTGQWLLLAMLLYTNKVVWYDLRIIMESLRGDSFRSILAIQGIVLAPFIAASLFGGIRILAKSRIVLLYPLMIVYGLLINMIHGVEYPIFALQDLFKFAFLPTGFMLAWLSRPATVDKFLKILAHAILGFLVIKILLFMAYYHSQYRLYYGGVLDVFPFCYFFANFCAGKKSATWKNGTLGALSFVLIMLGQKRTLFIALLAVVAYVSIKSRQSIGKKMAVCIAGIALVSTLLVFRQPLAEIAGARFERITQSRFDSTLGEDSARYREMLLIWELIGSSEWSRKWFGFGHGAAFDDEVPDVNGETLTHSVHFTPAAMLLRYGIVGVAFYLALAVGILFAPARLDATWLTFSDLLAIKSFVITAVIGSLVLYGLVDDMLVGVLLGFMTRANQRRHLPRAGVQAIKSTRRAG